VASSFSPDRRRRFRPYASLCHLLATVENGIVASKPRQFRPQAPTIRLVYISVRCRMLRIDEDTFTMISGLIVIAVVCIAGLLALAA
jgi:hypothetical protein